MKDPSGKYCRFRPRLADEIFSFDSAEYFIPLVGLDLPLRPLLIARHSS
jgi:hypothetical protein